MYQITEKEIIRNWDFARGILVSIDCSTYNHEQYISQALNGFLKQKTNFHFEIIVHDDASTDNTAKIIKKYQSQFPYLFRCIYQSENQYSKNEKNIWGDITFPLARGKYIALCEGDDYWTDPFKLQKQVDFLENNKDYSICFHRYKILDQESQIFRNDNCGFLFDNLTYCGAEINTELFLKHWVTQPATMVFRKDCFDISVIKKYHYFRDTHLIYHLLQNGKGYLFEFEGAVYREHLGGISSKKPWKHQVDMGIAVAKELFLVNNNNTILKDNFLKMLNWGINYYSSNKNISWNFFQYILSHFYYSLSWKRLLKHTRLFFLQKNLVG